MKYPKNYVSDTPGTIMVPHQAGFTEIQLFDNRIRWILDALATVEPQQTPPVQLPEYQLPPDFVKELGEVVRNEGRVPEMSRFLIIDLDSFKSFLMD